MRSSESGSAEMDLFALVTQPTKLVIKLNTALIRHNTVFKRLSAAVLERHCDALPCLFSAHKTASSLSVN